MIHRLVLATHIEVFVEDRNTHITEAQLKEPGYRHGLGRRLVDSLSLGSEEGGFALSEVGLIGVSYEPSP